MDIHEICDELGLRKQGGNYKGVVATGNFNCISDYNRGLLTLTIKNQTDLNYPIVIITTIDDGVWQGYGNHYINVDMIAKEFEHNFGVQLPTEKDFNEFLGKYGIYGSYSG